MRGSGLEKEVKRRREEFVGFVKGARPKKKKVVKTERRAVGREDGGETERRCDTIG